MKNNFLYPIIICYSILIYSCSDSKFVAKKHNEFVTNFKKNGTRILGGEYSKFKSPKSNFGMSKDILKLNKLVPNKNFDSTLFLFEIDFEYLNKMQKFVKKSKHKKGLIPITETEFNSMKWDFDSIRIMNMVPRQKIN